MYFAITSITGSFTSAVYISLISINNLFFFVKCTRQQCSIFKMQQQQYGFSLANRNAVYFRGYFQTCHDYLASLQYTPKGDNLIVRRYEVYSMMLMGFICAV